MDLASLEPRSVFRFFEEICAIPHGSGNTDAIGEYLVRFAQARGLAHCRDALGNVVMIAPAAPGYPYTAPGQPPAGTYSPYQQHPNVTYQQPMDQQSPMNAPYQQQPSASMPYQQPMGATYRQGDAIPYQQPPTDQPPLASAPYQQAPSAQLGTDDAPADDPAQSASIGTDEDA